MRGLDNRLRYQRVYQNHMKLQYNNEPKTQQSKRSSTRNSANNLSPVDYNTKRSKGDSQEMDQQPEAAAAGAADVD